MTHPDPALAAMTRELELRTVQLQALAKVGQAVASALNLDEVFQRIAVAAVEIAGADQGTIYDYDDAARRFVPRAMHGMDHEHADALRAMPVRLGEGAVGHAGATGQPWDVADVLIEPRYEGRMRELAVRSGMRAVAAVPMVRGNRITGGIVVRRRTPGAFGAERIGLLQIAAQSTLALQNERLLREIEGKNRQLEDAQRINAALEAQHTAAQMIEALPVPVFFKDAGGRYLGVNKAWESFHGIDRKECIGRTVFELYSRDAALADAIHAKDQALLQASGRQEYETQITLRDGRQRNTTYYKATYSRSDGQTAGLIGTIIDNTANKQEEARRAIEHAVTRELSESVPGVITRILQIIAEGSGWACGMHWTWDRRGEQLRCKDNWHANEPALAGFAAASAAHIIEAPAWNPTAAKKPSASGLVSSVWRDGAPVWFRDVAREPGFKRSANAAAAGLHCAFGFPILAGTQPLGVMEFYSSKIEEPDPALLRVVEAIGRQIGQHLQREDFEARNHEAEKYRAMEHAVTRVLSEAESLSAAITRVIQVICESLGWACGTHKRWDEKAELLRFAQAWHIDAPEVKEFLTSISARVTEAPASPVAAASTALGLSRRVWSTGVPVWIPDVTQDPTFRRAAAAAKAGLHCAFGFPVLVGSQPMGVMEFYSRKTEAPEEALLRVVEALGRQIGQFIRRRESETRNSELETVSSNKSLFLANMSHELRTPLNAIIGYSEMLLEDAAGLEDPRFTDDLNKIHASGKHLLGLINDILDLSKIEAGKMELHYEVFDIASMVENVAATIRPSAQKNGNTVIVECAPGLGCINADMTRVFQSLLNLVSNAVKFTKDGVIRITGSRYIVPGSETIMLQVIDSGIGMTEEQVGRLFRDFEQADGSTTRKYGGTGLGLAISRRFCRLMGGDIVVHSTLGRGSTFTIQLPGAEESRLPREAPPAVRPTPAVLRDGRPLVLVVDDDPAVREFMRRFLEQQNYAAIAATNGIEALEMARQQKPAAITLDVMMPGVDGWTVLAALKGDPALAHIPVILITIVDERQRGYTLGASDYMIKPVDRTRLGATLKTLCGRSDGCALLVDDDENARTLMCTAIGKEGWTVMEAGNGRIALDKLAQSAPDIIILDLMMPEMDGFEFLDEMRKHEQWRSIPVLVVTAMNLTSLERERLNGKVEIIIEKSGQHRDALLREIGITLAARVGAKLP